MSLNQSIIYNKLCHNSLYAMTMNYLSIAIEMKSFDIVKYVLINELFANKSLFFIL